MKVGIIGGGASGLFLATLLEKSNHEIILFERNNKLGRKLLITGKGRCNLLNYTDPEQFLNNVVRGKNFFKSSIYKYTPKFVFEYFSNLGLKLKIERGNRVFPESDKSSDVVDTLVKQLKKTTVRLNEKVVEITGNYIIDTDKDRVPVDIVIICTGGITYPKTGSDGSGYKLAKKYNINTITPCASLIPLEVVEDVSSLEGISLKNIRVTAIKNNKIIFSDFGEMLFTKHGMSGPIILTLSAYLNREKNFEILLDLKPALNNSVLEKRILSDFDNRKNQEIQNGIRGLLIERISDYVLEKSSIEPSRKVNSVTKQERKELIKNIKNLKFHFKKFAGNDQGVITSGGIDLNDLLPTFESKMHKNLYFIGEVVDIDALTGGYNLQIAFSSALKVYDDIIKK